MKNNIVIAIILSISFIICATILARDRYKIIMNNGELSGSITIKYDTVSGETWRLVLPESYWSRVPDPGRVYVVPELNEKKR